MKLSDRDLRHEIQTLRLGENTFLNMDGWNLTPHREFGLDHRRETCRVQPHVIMNFGSDVEVEECPRSKFVWIRMRGGECSLEEE